MSSGAALAVALALAPAVVAQPDFSATPIFGTFTLVTGFVPDPQPVPVLTGGPDDASMLGLVDAASGEPCRGWMNGAAPDVRVSYPGGEAFPLRFYVASDSDTTLCVNLPDATWRCNDDTVGLNPVVQVDAPASGQYDIWIGNYAGGAPEPATLYVTELATNGPP
ncbi:MAG: peptidase S1 [Deltaproteobacteria bacterium]|nr:peptidase S1 [Deltaproteobacteria bacterium]